MVFHCWKWTPQHSMAYSMTSVKLKSSVQHHWNSKDKWILILSAVLIFRLKNSNSFLLSDIEGYGSRPDLGSTASTESQDFPSSPDVTQISLARTSSTRNKWTTTKFGIWTALLSPLNRSALASLLLGPGQIKTGSLAESKMMFEKLDYWITTLSKTQCMQSLTQLHVGSVWIHVGLHRSARDSFFLRVTVLRS